MKDIPAVQIDCYFICAIETEFLLVLCNISIHSLREVPMTAVYGIYLKAYILTKVKSTFGCDLRKYFGLWASK